MPLACKWSSLTVELVLLFKRHAVSRRVLIDLGVLGVALVEFRHVDVCARTLVVESWLAARHGRGGG